MGKYTVDYNAFVKIIKKENEYVAEVRIPLSASLVKSQQIDPINCLIPLIFEKGNYIFDIKNATDKSGKPYVMGGNEFRISKGKKLLELLCKDPFSFDEEDIGEVITKTLMFNKQEGSSSNKRIEKGYNGRSRLQRSIDSPRN
ncbi:MAG: hypothetical protein WC438_03740 [Candidatus Pacearchaeota archaeon]